MSRDILLKQKKEKEEALKEISQKYKDLASIKYDLYNEDGTKAGFFEYAPSDDTVYLSIGHQVRFDARILKSLREVIGKLLDE